MLDIFGLPEMVGVSRLDHHIWIGGATTHAEIAVNPITQNELPTLTKAASEVGGVQIQNRGTIGGNIANSSPVGDLLPVLLALDATIMLRSVRGERTIPYWEFCTGYRQTALLPDELVVGIKIPIPSETTIHFWRKVGTRLAHATSKVMVAAAGRITEDTENHIRIGIGAVAEQPIRLYEVEALLSSRPLENALIEEARNLTISTLQPIDDVRSSADYRRIVAANLIGRFAETLLFVENASS